MKIFYGLTKDGKHLQANAQVPSGEMTAEQRAVLVEVFAILCQHSVNQSLATPAPPRIGDYVLVECGMEGDKCYVDYARRN